MCGKVHFILKNSVKKSVAKNFQLLYKRIVSHNDKGLARYSRDPGFGQNTPRDSGEVHGVRDLTATWRRDSP